MRFLRALQRVPPGFVLALLAIGVVLWPGWTSPAAALIGDEGLEAFMEAGLLSADLGPAPQVDAVNDTDEAVRGYLHANCAFCHNPEGLVPNMSYVQIDWSYDSDLSEAIDGRIYYYHDANPFSVEYEVVIDPGDPSNSQLINLMLEHEMPPLSVWTPDYDSLDLVKEWIRDMPEGGY